MQIMGHNEQALGMVQLLEFGSCQTTLDFEILKPISRRKKNMEAKMHKTNSGICSLYFIL